MILTLKSIIDLIIVNSYFLFKKSIFFLITLKHIMVNFSIIIFITILLHTEIQ